MCRDEVGLGVDNIGRFACLQLNERLTIWGGQAGLGVLELVVEGEAIMEINQLSEETVSERVGEA